MRFITGFVSTVTRRVLLVDHQLITLPETSRSSPVFNGVYVARYLVFCVVFCKSLFVLFSFFFLIIVSSDDSFGIFKFLKQYFPCITVVCLIDVKI